MHAPVILIDMDECLVDLIPAWLDRYNCDWDDDLVPNDITDWDISRFVRLAARPAVMAYLREPRFFRDLEPRPGALDAVRAISAMGWDVRIASMPSGPDSAADKIRWIEHWLGDIIPESAIILGADKAMYRAAAIIDDRPMYLEELAGSMTTICIGSAYNTGLRDVVDLWAGPDPAQAWAQVVEFLAIRIKELAPTPVIAFLAAAGSGKTTAANYLRDRYGAVVMSFATPIKRIGRDVFDFTDDQLFGANKEAIDPRYGISPRWFLQRLGCGARDHLWDGIWLDVVMTEIRSTDAALVVIDDCRFVNEATRVATDPGIAGTVIRIDAGTRAHTVLDDASEREIPEVPAAHVSATIRNDETVSVQALYEQLDGIMTGLGIEPRRDA